MFGSAAVFVPPLRFHAERAIDIITHILPEDHLLLASSKRVKGKACFLETLASHPLCVSDTATLL